MDRPNRNENPKVSETLYAAQVRQEGEINLIKENLLEKYHDNRSEIFRIMTECSEFGNKLREKYPEDYSNYSLYHILVGGTPPLGCTNFDFPGDDSIYKYFKKFEDMEKKKE